jgi:hypothetical protein
MSSMSSRNTITLVALALLGVSARAAAQPSLFIRDYVAMPMTGSLDPKAHNEILLARINTLREERSGARRLFLSDLNGPLYIFDKASKKFTTRSACAHGKRSTSSTKAATTAIRAVKATSC